MRVKILTYNIHIGVPCGYNFGNYITSIKDLENLAAVIKNSGAEIVGLNEVDRYYCSTAVSRSGNLHESKELGRLTGMNYAYGSTRDDGPYPGPGMTHFIEWGNESEVHHKAKRLDNVMSMAAEKMGVEKAQKLDDVLRVTAEKMGLEIVDLDMMIVDPSLKEDVSEKVAKHFSVLPVKKEGDTLTIALADPFNVQLKADLKILLGNHLKFVLAREKQIECAIKKYYESTAVEPYHLVISKGAYGNAQLSRHGFQDIFNYKLPNNPENEQRCMLMTEQIIDGKTVHIYNVHIQHSLVPSYVMDRWHQIHRIAEIIQADRCEYKVLMGDFNWDSEYPAVLEQDVPEKEIFPVLERTGMVDAVKLKSPQPPKTFPADNPVERLDYVFVTPKIQVVGFQVLDTLASDHRPLLVEVELG